MKNGRGFHREQLVKAAEVGFAVVLALSLLALIGCNKASTTDSSSQVSTIQGTVTDDQGSFSAGKFMKTDAAVQGAIVVAARVLADGSLTAISDSALTNSSGHFSVTCDATNITNAVVVATKSGTKWEAVVSDNLAQGGTETCPPLNSQTTAQAGVYVKMVTDVGADGVVFDDIGLYVSSAVATAIQNNLGAETQVASALEAGESAWQSAMVNASLGNSSQQGIQSIYYARMNAQAGLQSSLYTAGENQTAMQTAFQGYEAAELSLYESNGLDADAIAKVHEIVGRAIANAALSASSDVQLSLLRQIATIRAFMVHSAVKSQLQILGATQAQMNSADSAYAVLNSSITAATTSDLMKACFGSYHNSIVTMASGISGLNSSAVASLDGQINASGGAKTTLMAAVTSRISSQALAQAYATFFTTVSSSCNAGMSGVSGPRVQAVAEILMLTNMGA